ncbi:MAG: GTP-binding protein [Pseudomonadota bacterium]
MVTTSSTASQAVSPARPSPIPVTIVTGFLGAGKTTLVNQLLRDPDFAETAVLINEFGDIQIDHDLVADFSDDLIMTTTGCLCCTASSDIAQSLNDLLARMNDGEISPFKRVIVETTGLMDPIPVLVPFLAPPAYDPTSGPLRGQFALSRLVTLFDIVNGPKTLDNHEEALRQVAVSDVLLVTKTDLALDPATQRDIIEDKKRLSLINPGARILDRHSDWQEMRDLLLKDGSYDLRNKGEDALTWLNIEKTMAEEHNHSHHHAHDHGHGHHHHHHHDHSDINRHGDDIRSHVIISEEPVSAVAFSFFLDTLKMIAGTDLLRLKGLVALSDDPERPVVVHGVQHLIHPTKRLSQWPSEDRRTKIVVIGHDIDIEALRTVLMQLETTN